MLDDDDIYILAGGIRSETKTTGPVRCPLR